MGLKEDFEAAAARSRTLPPQGNDSLLELYGLFKQATEGDVTGDPPGFFDLRGQAKYDAWEARRGMSREAAMQAYVALVARLAG
jgi:acyl-CoA-binding protein